MRGPLDRGWSRIICVASGPSLAFGDQKELIRRECGAGRWRVIVTNLTGVDFPNADLLFGADLKFWQHCREEVARFAGERWTADPTAAERYGLTHVRHDNGTTLSAEVIATGGNSGQAIATLAYALGAVDIVLCGFDMQHTGGKLRPTTGLLRGGKIHHHGPHPLPLANPAAAALKTWAARLDSLAPQFAAAGVRVRNATATTALRAYPRVDLKKTLEETEQCPALQS